MNNKWILGALGVVAVLSVAPSAQAQRKSGAENSLIGIKLYDSGLRVVSIYGTPDRIEGVGGGGGAIGPGGGGPGGPGGAPGGSGGPMAPQRSGEGGGPGAAGSAWHNDLSNLGDTIFQKGGMAPSGPTGPGGGGQQMGAAAPGAAGPAGPGGPGGGGVGPAAGSGGRVIFTRWIYNRNGSKYGFVLDKANRVVQIEALGLQNAKVRTARGIGFGSTFAQLIKKYNTPDGYEISGDNVVVRFLVRNKVAFRLSRLGPNKPQVVTGIVVAAGKN